MLNMIKNLINEKTSFLEEASMIYEDATSGQIDDSIILGEDTSDDEVKSGEDSNEKEFEIRDEDENDSFEDENEAEEDEGHSDEDSDIMDTPVENEPETPGDSNDLLNQSINSTDNQDTPHDDVDDILNVEINLKSNTMSDVLPVPPASAGEAVPSDDDTLNTRIDSGFENDTLTESEYEELFEATRQELEFEKALKDHDNLIKTFKKYKEKSAKLGGTKDRDNKINELINRKSKEVIDSWNNIIKKFGDIPIQIQIDQTHGMIYPGLRFIPDKNGEHNHDHQHLMLNPLIINTKRTYSDIIKKRKSQGYGSTVIDSYINTGHKMSQLGKDYGYKGSKLPDGAKTPAGKYDFNFKESINNISMSDFMNLIESMNTNEYDTLGEFLEAITLGDGDTTSDTPADTNSTDSVDSDTTSDAPADTPAENEVTAAVRDKVAEADSGNEPTTSKDELLKKLGNITKSLEDAKRAVMNSISN